MANCLGQQLPSLEGADQHWKDEWKPIIDMLQVYIHHPKKIKSHIRMTLNLIASNLEEKPGLFCPEIAVADQDSQLVLRSYKDFLSTITNCLLIMLSKDLDYSKLPGIAGFYENLLKRLFYSCGSLFVYLVDKFMSSLKNILDVYVNSVGFYPPIAVGTFAVTSSSKIPEDCRSLVRLNGLDGAKSAVSFLTEVVFNSHELILQSPLGPKFLQLILKRLEAWDQFNYCDLTSQNFLTAFPFHKYHEIIPLLMEISSEVVAKVASEKQSESLKKLKEQIAKLYLKDEFSLLTLSGIMFPLKLKGVVLKHCDDHKEIEISSAMVKLVSKLLKLGIVDLTDLEIKWLAHKFTGGSEVAGLLLLSSLETELRRAIPFLQTTNTSRQTHTQQKITSTRRSLNQNWQNAEDHSKVWQILQSYFFKKLEKLVRVDGTSQKAPLPGIKKLHFILNELQKTICLLDQEQKSNPELNSPVSFSFFPVNFEKVIAQMGILPNHCIESMPAKDKASREQTEMSIQSWQQVLEMLNILRLLPDSCKLDAVDLASIEVLCGLPWLTVRDKCDVPEKKLEWYTHLAETLQRKLQMDVPESLAKDVLQLFCVEFSKTKIRPTAWRVRTIVQCLATFAGENLDIVLKSLPIIIASCQREDIKIIFTAFMKTRLAKDLSVVKSIAEVLPSIVCSLSGCCEIQESTLKSENEALSRITVRILCSECNKDCKLAGPKGWNFLNLVGKFTQEWEYLISHKSNEIRLLMAKAFPKILKHLGSTLETRDIKIWLALLSDSDPIISEEFTVNVASILKLTNDPEKKVENSNLVLEQIGSLIANTWRNKTSWNPVFYVFDTLLKTQEEHLVRPVMRLMIKLIALKRDDVCGINQMVAENFFLNNHTSSMVIFFQCQDENWSVILETMEIQEPVDRNIFHCFSRICNIFNLKTQVLKKHLFRFLQVLIPKCLSDPTFLYILKDTAEYLKLPQQIMLKKWHTMLYPVFVVNHPDCLSAYLKLADCDDDVERFLTLIIIQVIINFSGNAGEIFDRLSNILKESDDKPGLSPDEVSQHVQYHLLGILDTIQSNVLNKYASQELKLKTLKGFGNMLGLMSKEAVSPVFSKILDVLCTFKNLKEPDLVKAYCLCLLSFLKSLENDKIASVMFTVMTIVTFLDKDKYFQEVKEILDFFLVFNKKHIKQKAFYLINLTDLLEDYEYSSILQNYRDNFCTRTVDEMLECKVDALSCTYVESQILTLKTLKKYLSSIQPELQEILFSHNRECQNLNQIIGKLISGASSSNPDMRLPSIECLSLLGAIDPGHWIVSQGFKAKTKFFFDSSCAEFVCRALETLLDGFQASMNKADMDIIGFVCQEFMKANDFQDEPAKAPVQIWNQFSDQAKTMLIPFFTSSYIAKFPTDFEELPHPLFGSKMCQNFEDWIFHWVVRLIGMIKNKSTRDVFNALRLVFKINLNSVEFFLPHIFTHAIWAASADDLDKIAEEMVLAAKLFENDHQPSEEESLEIVFQALGLNFDMQSFVDLHAKDLYTSRNEMSLKCAKIIFFLVDYLIHWNMEYEQAPQGGASGKSRSSRESSCSDSSRDLKTSALAYKYRINRDFLARFNLKIASEQSHNCNENFRALRYLDMHCLKKKESIEHCSSLFVQVHSQLQNSDFVHGISSGRKGATAKWEQLLLYEMSGQSQDSIIWYEKMLTNGEGDMHEIVSNMTKAHLHLEQYQPVLGIVNNYSSKTTNTKFRNALIASKLEANWRMGAWEQLQQTLSDLTEKDKTWAFYFAKILASIFNFNLEEMNKNILEMRKALGEWLNRCGATSSSYANNYPAFLMMHLLTDVEIAVKLLHPSEDIGSLSSNEQIEKISSAIVELESRQKRISFEWKGLQMVLSVRRTLLSLLQHVLAGFSETDEFIKSKIGLLWLESAKIAVSQRQFPQALGYTISGEHCGLKDTFILQAQLQWESGARELALMYLHRGVNKYFPDWETFKTMVVGTREQDRKSCAKAKLLIADYSIQMKIVDYRAALTMYKEACSCFQQWEEPWVHVARAWDTIKENKELITTEAKIMNVLNEIVKSYTLALSFGVKHLYESLPRVITIWANTGCKLFEMSKNPPSERVDVKREYETRKKLLTNSFKQYNEHLKNLCRRLPKYAFYACFNSLSSRICNPYKPVYTLIQEVLVNLLKEYPYQMLWKLVPMLKVTQVVRVNRIQEVLLSFGTHNEQMNKLMNEYLKLCSCLFDFGHLPVKSQSSRAKMSNLMPKLVEFFQKPANRTESEKCKILMPTDNLLSVILPDDDCTDYRNHNPFPREQVFITRVLEPVVIISSLQKPKQFTLHGSDDKEYSWLVKNKDDLRIDATVMHFMQVLNNLLEKDSECKERRLICKTYSVVALGEDCGLIEFVPNLITLRQVIMNLYKGKGEKNEPKEELKKNDSVEQKRKVFEDYLLPVHPPVLSDWFHWKFADHSSWNEARKRFILSTAVMSVVGYILGLGDRHGGNIMLNQLTGESVHVDYNCVFNKGETLPWPEKVPFRLTHNMATAMGVAGIEGPYRKAAELTLRVMRQNSETLLSVLRPMVFDATYKDRIGSKEDVEFMNGKVVKSLQRVNMRLNGVLNDTTEEKLSAVMTLSPAGQAHSIIRQATDVNNLCQMYPGWGAFY